MKDFAKFEEKIKIKFNDKDLLAQAFTHRSYLNENRQADIGHNERLEFLGDAVLELAVTDFLYKKYPEKPEGELTNIRSALVNFQTLSNIALEIGVNDLLLLSKGESKDTGRARTYILANTFESIIGAIYIDQGYVGALKFVSDFVLPLSERIVAEGTWIDAKSKYQEKAQEDTGITPSYRTIKETGPDHDRQFTVGVYLAKKLIATGEGKSKQDAEQDAAKKALENGSK